MLAVIVFWADKDDKKTWPQHLFGLFPWVLFGVIPGFIVGALVGAVYARMLRGAIPRRSSVVTIGMLAATLGSWTVLAIGTWSGTLSTMLWAFPAALLMGLVPGALAGRVWHYIWSWRRVQTTGDSGRASRRIAAMIVVVAVLAFSVWAARRIAWPLTGRHRTETLPVYWEENASVPGRIVYRLGKYGHQLPPESGLRAHLEAQNSIIVPLEIDIQYDATGAIAYYPTRLAGFPLMSPLDRLDNAPLSVTYLPAHLRVGSRPTPTIEPDVGPGVFVFPDFPNESVERPDNRGAR